MRGTRNTKLDSLPPFQTPRSEEQTRNKDSLISVIVPVYNVAPYLQKCVTSILCQTYTHLELILVDDGSTDGSSELCDHLGAQDSRIHIYHQRNQGVSSARNLGIDVATGDFLCFVDADDWIDSSYLESLLCLPSGPGIPLRISSTVVLEQGSRSTKKELLTPGSQNATSTFQALLSLDATFVVLCLFSTRVFENGHNRFDCGIACGEDVLFLFELFREYPKVQVAKTDGYHYRLRSGSASRRTLSEKTSWDLIHVSQHLSSAAISPQEIQGALRYSTKMAIWILTSAGSQSLALPARKYELEWLISEAPQIAKYAYLPFSSWCRFSFLRHKATRALFFSLQRMKRRITSIIKVRFLNQ